MSKVMVSFEWVERVKTFLKSNPEFEKNRPVRIYAPPTPKYKDKMKMFAWLITYQAISTKVCGKIWADFEAVMKDLGHLDVWSPEIVMSLTDAQLKGLSKSKKNSVRDMARFLIDKAGVLDDEKSGVDDIVRAVNVKGVSGYTVKHYLWQNGRLDVSLEEDIVFRKGLGRIYGLGPKPTVAECRKITEKWGAFKSIGTMYCFLA